MFLILKFGGTSIGSAQKIKDLVKIITDPVPKIIVLSAMSGTTNDLVAICKNLFDKNITEATYLINNLEKKYQDVITELFNNSYGQIKAKQLLLHHFDYILSFTRDVFNTNEEKAILAQGELISTALFHYYLEEIGINSVLLPALNFMKMDDKEEPDYRYIEKYLNEELDKNKPQQLFITQGYICRNAFGEIDNLKRGGSDYSASIIGNAVNSSEIQIWTDIDGMHNNDPRFVNNTRPVYELSFDEAAELAYFGAKILHPTCILPAKKKNIPVRLKNTMQPKAPGTLISNIEPKLGIKAIAAKDGITAITIKSDRMLLAHGFLRAVFEIFERFKTPIDMICTSEISVSLTIDNTAYLEAIIQELKEICSVEIDRDQTIICIVGQIPKNTSGFGYKVMDALKDIPLRMVSYGGSSNNISVLVNSNFKKEALQTLNNKLFI